MSGPDRLPLVALPTSLDRLERWGRDLGVELWIKRDDRTDVLLTGNKARKLEYVLAEAVAGGADTLIACGGAQSNLCRVVALIAARLGMRASFLMGTADPERPPRAEGNLVLSLLAGAELRWVRTSDMLARSEALLEEAAAEARRRGHRPYVVPLAASGPLGTWGYVRAVEEIAAQLPDADRPARIVYPVASGGTGAGVLLGIRQSRLAARALGVVVAQDHMTTARRQILGYLEATCRRFGIGERFAEADVELVDGSGGGYSVSGPEEARVIAELARQEGIVLDPVYTAKALLAVERLVRGGQIGREERIVFVHTGGVYGLFPHADGLLGHLRSSP